MKILFICLSLFFLIGFLIKPTEKQISDCMEATGYSSERCEFELTR